MLITNINILIAMVDCHPLNFLKKLKSENQFKILINFDCLIKTCCNNIILKCYDFSALDVYDFILLILLNNSNII